MTAPDPLLLTIPETAEVLAISARTVERLLHRGELARVRIGSSVRVSVRSIESFIASREQSGPHHTAQA